MKGESDRFDCQWIYNLSNSIEIAKQQQCLTCKCPASLAFPIRISPLKCAHLFDCVLVCRAYDLQLSDAMNDLQEQVKVEKAPTDTNEHGVEVGTFVTTDSLPLL